MNKHGFFALIVGLLLATTLTTPSQALRKSVNTSVTTEAGSIFDVELLIDSNFYKNQNYWMWVNVTCDDFGKDVTALYQIDLSVNIFKEKPDQPDELDHENYITGGYKTLNFDRLDVFEGTIFSKAVNVTVETYMLNATAQYYATVLLIINEKASYQEVTATNMLTVWEGWISGEEYTSITQDTPSPFFEFIVSSVMLALFSNHLRRKRNKIND
ncbi:MAG: hypothetical protein D6732_29250 [Methanobacteriota archaeon]|nr:MAG: hypothetical protein D6732_29250 [Euryarchaeota archaeon]